MKTMKKQKNITFLKKYLFRVKGKFSITCENLIQKTISR